MTNPRLIILALAFAIPACSASPARSVAEVPRGAAVAPDDPDDIERIAANYSALRSMTSEPFLVDADIARLCTAGTQAALDAARERSGPHALSAVRIYMSDAAAKEFVEINPRYPVGSVIVKQKVKWGPASDAHGSPSRNGVGGMIKRAPGYDPAHGDWEYFYFEEAAKIERGRIESCIRCHRRAADTDHVFGDWAGKTRPTRS